MPAYNSAKTIGRALKSLLEEQDFALPYEVIIELDPSKDDTLAIAKSFQAKHPELTIDAPETRMGIGKSRFEGLMKVQGKYFYFMDADDYLSKDCLSSLYKGIEESGADCFNCSFSWIDSSKGKTRRFMFARNAVLNHKQAFMAYFNDASMRGFCWSKIYSSEILKKRPLLCLGAPLDSQFEDAVLNCSLLHFSNKVAMSKKALYYYDHSQGESAMSSKRNNRAFRHVVVFALERYYLEQVADSEALSAFKHRLFRSYLSIRYDLSLDKKSGADKAYVSKVKKCFSLLKNMSVPLKKEGSFFEEDANEAWKD